MGDIWLDGFERIVPAPGAYSGTMLDVPRRFVCHTTEGLSMNPAGVAAGHPNPPHLWVCLPSHPYQPRWRGQIYPLNVSARALSHPPGTPETNKMGAIQVEIEGRAAEAGGWSHEDLDWLADEVIGPACRATGVNVSVYIQGVGDPKLAAGKASSTRMGARQWRDFNGLCSHQNVPDNDHWDAGGLDLGYISSRLTHTTPEDDMPLTPDEIETIAERVTAHLANPDYNPGTVIDPGARGALDAINVGVNDPTSGLRSMISKLGPGQIVEALPDEIAHQVFDLLKEQFAK